MAEGPQAAPAGDHRDVDAALSGLDGPRVLPPTLAERLTAALADAASPLTGTDGSRPLPPEVREAIVASIGTTTAGHPSFFGSSAARSAHQLPKNRRVAAAAAAAVLVVLGLVAAATRPTSDPAGDVAADVAADAGATTTTTRPADPDGTPVVALAESEPAYARLETFGTCDELLGWVRSHAEAEVTEHGLDGGGPRRMGGGFGRDFGAGPGAALLGSDRAASGHSVTNVQEAGVDEPDRLKVDDDALYLLNGTDLVLVDLDDGQPTMASTVPHRRADSFPTSLVLDGDRLAVLAVDRVSPRGATQVRLLDVGDPAAPAEVETVALPGTLLDARLVDHVLHVVTGWNPGPFGFTFPTDGSPEAIEQARQANREVVRQSTLEQWVPPGVECESVRRPRDLAGFSTTLVTSFPLDDPGSSTSSGVLADAGSVYASTDRLVISTVRWDAFTAGGEVRTNLHRFALDTEGARYTASGSVVGWTRSSYSLSEHDGYLRVAATDQPFPTPEAPPSTSTVTVLGEEDGLLVPVGSVGGLGVGQQIQGVRFVGDVAYVVTFRRTDPLYTIDLSDPTAPEVRGALEVTGFSGYLHPLDDGRLLGVGVEADEAGFPTGGAVSIYDVADLDRPSLRHRLVAPGTNYLATDDPHALLLWEPTGQLVLPDFRNDGQGGASVFRLDDGLVAQGTVTHAGRPSAGSSPGTDPGFVFLNRAAMVDGVLYTVSSAGVLASNPETLADVAWLPLPVGPCC